MKAEFLIAALPPASQLTQRYSGCCVKMGVVILRNTHESKANCCFQGSNILKCPHVRSQRAPDQRHNTEAVFCTVRNTWRRQPIEKWFQFELCPHSFCRKRQWCLPRWIKELIITTNISVFSTTYSRSVLIPSPLLSIILQDTRLTGKQPSSVQEAWCSSQGSSVICIHRTMFWKHETLNQRH